MMSHFIEDSLYYGLFYHRWIHPAASFACHIATASYSKLFGACAAHQQHRPIADTSHSKIPASAAELHSCFRMASTIHPKIVCFGVRDTNLHTAKSSVAVTASRYVPEVVS